MPLQEAKAEPPGAAPRSRVRALIARIPLHRALLLIIIILAFGTRALRCSEGLPYLHNWDEPSTASTALRILQTGDFNPHFFNYGSVMIYLNLAVDTVHYFHLASRPETGASSLIRLSHIKTKYDTGYQWTISHPSFYYWNRLLTALMGTGSVLIAYFLARDLKGHWAGILAAGLLTGIDFHIDHSAWVTPNVPSAFFGMIGVLLAVRFVRFGGPGCLVGAAAACGLAASTKYNTAISLIAPLLVLGFGWWDRQRRGQQGVYRGWLWPALVFVFLLAFIAGTPYAVVDLPHFVEDVAYEIWHYEVDGHPGATVQTGLTYLLLQVGMVIERIGILTSVFVALGIAVALTSLTGWVTFAFPLAFLIFMSGTRVSLHRNFVVLYPFASVAFGCGVMIAARLSGWTRLGPGARRLVSILILVLGAAACVEATARSLPTSWKIAAKRETRSLTIDRINELAASKMQTPPYVGVAEELRFHHLDLARLKVRHEEVPFIDLLCSGKNDYDLLVTPREFSEDRQEQREGVALMDAILSSRTSIVAAIGPEKWLPVTYLNNDPRILILSRTEDSLEGLACSDPLVLQSIARDGTPLPGAEPWVDLHEVRSTSTGWVSLTPGPHAFVWDAHGTTGARVPPQLRYSLRLRFGGVVAEREGQTYTVALFESPYGFRFEVPTGAEVSLSFEKVLGGKIYVQSVRTLDLSGVESVSPEN